MRRIKTILRVQALESRLTPANSPLPDLGPGFYQGFQGGLYPNGAHAPPAAHRADGLTIAQNQILPLNSAGQPDPAAGKIVMISVGMSNTTQEFGSTANSFKVRADADDSVNPRLMIVDGAQGGKAADDWVSPTAPTWTTVQNRLTNAGVTAQQVQIAWVKQADRQPYQYGAFPAHAQHLQGELEAIVRNLKTHYPNIRITYVSSRTMSYKSQQTALNPEPFAYESGFATQWMIGEQVGGAADLNYDPDQGAVVAPYLSWGPYLWADGTNPRSDGFTWLTSDLKADLTHPSDDGVLKVSDQLLSFFKTDPTAVPWFLRSAVIGQPPTANPTASVTSGVAPLTVQFNAQASDDDGTIRETAWTFDDGTFSRSATPVKTFKNPGTYTTRLTVVDDAGNPVEREVTIQVMAPTTPPTAAVQDNGGFPQRSRVVNLRVTFSESPSFPDGLAAAIQLQRTGPGSPAGPVALSFNQNGNQVLVTFNDPTFAPVGGSLIDGNYTLTLDAGSIVGAAGPLDGNGDGIGGDDLTHTFHRLFGDADGDRDVDAADFGAFRTAFGSTVAVLDFDGDGDVDAFDFGQFRQRFGSSV